LRELREFYEDGKNWQEDGPQNWKMKLLLGENNNEVSEEKSVVTYIHK
jgi:hypothetical protein